ncbi:YqaJ viral recombinase family protein [Novosphingobium mathurense]|uniref:Phage-related protein, predicted endonuclease n=1 Tax=Novosphingobium mathurense TaxID=428990 RepID=A0A1U6I7J7_9SPHN|nr:YqaJ viral recombinase family protein [Novosphingobium mathurense]SLK03986.1 Phage-related protein, predicted endonuclease [Novosphingobium mathurense]
MTTQPDKDAIFRAKHVGASEVSALFDCNPWLTHFELWHRKTGTIATPDFNAIKPDGSPENERIFWGVKLEAAIIDAARERYGYVDREDTGPLSNGRGLGGHPDRRVICPERGPIVLETKMVDWLERKKWGDEPPLNYLLQGNTYAGLDRVCGFDMLVLVGGNKLERIQYDFRPKLFAAAEQRTEAFWQSIADNKPPKPDYTRDGSALKEIYAEQGDETVDLERDNRAAIVAAEYLEAAADEREARARKEAAQAELVDKLKGAAVGFAEGFIIKATKVASIPDREAKPGEIIKGRKGYRRFAIKELEA